MPGNCSILFMGLQFVDDYSNCKTAEAVTTNENQDADGQDYQDWQDIFRRTLVNVDFLSLRS